MTFAKEPTGSLYAISDMHLDFKKNMEALHQLPIFPGSRLITGGDLCTKPEHLRTALSILTQRFDRVYWVPGNHELWSSKKPESEESARGVDKYLWLVDICREFNVLTPEDPFDTWHGVGGPCTIAPLFIPYDYSFMDDPNADWAAWSEQERVEKAVAWAVEDGILCSDEKLINTTPYRDIAEWCRARVGYSHDRLRAIPPDRPIILVNHFPLRGDLVRLRPQMRRFRIWCGTNLTEQWHREFNIACAISGHLHIRATDYRDGVRFEEVSLGYPRDWEATQGIGAYLRVILPAPAEPEQTNHHTVFHRRGNHRAERLRRAKEVT
ncbi:metallophosphoesterase family protein [Acanthopleuribacter pedis]|uniref:Metallophosphoesterase n=1 Tax=Acanthopleuribacter pedis TaxID=442870 RepID=A0A8J7U104_9BACT|nr:metallophosphoesterase [Acanthopleuribacter pedis]MBO1317643.1 metallophosphoesterase [Acanthopleuribacter pedis]